MQVRMGQFASPTASWVDIDGGYIFRQKGAHTTSTAYEQLDVVTYNNGTYICDTAHTSATAAPDATKFTTILDGTALTTATASASTSATNAAASETAAAASEVASAASETASAASEVASASSASAASTSQSAASTSASAASTSQSAAASSASSAAADLATFQGQYHGAAATAPTTGLDDGDLYFDTSNDVMMVYDATNTTWRRTTPTSTDQTSINSAVSNATNINTVAANNTNITAVAGISANVTTVAGISADITTCAGKAAEIQKVADDLNEAISEIETVADDLNEATSEIDTVAASITNVDLVGTDITNVNTVASNISGVNSFAEKYRVQASAPSTSLDSGDLWYDTTSGAMKVYTGSSFVTSAGFASFATTDMSDVSGTVATNGQVLKYATGSTTYVPTSLANTDISGLGGAATLDVGTATGTVSAGDHNHSGVYATSGHNHTGTYEPADSAIQTHLSASDPHREIDDAATGTTDLWSASKINTEITALGDPVVMAIALG